MLYKLYCSSKEKDLYLKSCDNPDERVLDALYSWGLELDFTLDELDLMLDLGSLSYEFIK